MISGDFLMGWNLLQILTSDRIIITMMVIISKMVVKMVMTMLLMTILVMLIMVMIVMMVIIVLVEWCRRHRGAQGDCRTKKYFQTFKKCDDHSKKDDHNKK